MNLPAYLGRRLLFALPLVIGITLATFLISHVVPADPLGMVLSERAMQNPEIVKAYRERFGLDRPLPEQYLIYLRNVLQGDYGTSISTPRPGAPPPPPPRGAGAGFRADRAGEGARGAGRGAHARPAQRPHPHGDRDGPRLRQSHGGGGGDRGHLTS